MATGVADKLIAKAAREVLKPLGLFQAGTSRIWIDDNGWFLTVVEFQPSSRSKGAYLNVSISFLWDQGKGFLEVLPYNIGGRELGHEDYTNNDDQFYQQMLKMAEHAKKKAEEYRLLSGSRMVLNRIDSPSNVIKAFTMGMYHYFSGDEKSGDHQMKLLLEHSADELEYELGGKTHKRDWVVEHIEAAQCMLSKTQAEKTGYIVRSIIEKRHRLRSKAKYKKLPVDPVFQ